MIQKHCGIGSTLLVKGVGTKRLDKGRVNNHDAGCSWRIYNLKDRNTSNVHLYLLFSYDTETRLSST